MASDFSADRQLQDADLAELERVLVAAGLGAGGRAAFNGDVADALVAALNEPQWLLRIFVLRALRLSRGPLRIAADRRHHRLLRCPHDLAWHVADDDTAGTGRALCADCDAVVVDVDHLFALHPELPDCAFFRGPILPTLPWWWLTGPSLSAAQRPVFKGVRVNRWGDDVVTIGGDGSDDVVVPALQPTALRLHVHDDGMVVDASDGISVVMRSPWWGEAGSGRDLSLGRSHLRGPARASLQIWQPHRAEAIVVDVDRADALALDIIWLDFRETSRLRLYEPMVVSFDGLVEVVATLEGVVVHYERDGVRAITALVADEPLAVSTHSELRWHGRRLEVRGVAPPLSRAGALIERLQRGT